MNDSAADTNIRSSDRVLTLKPIDAKAAKSSTGLMDPRLFTGEQQLHLTMDTQTMLWNFRYSNNGVLPEPLKSRFTSFRMAYKHAEDYFKKRNIQITEVHD